MTEAIAAAAKALMKKLAVDLALDKDKRNKFLLIVGSIVVGLIFLLMTPVVVLSSIGGIDPPTVELEFNESDFLNNLDDESRKKLEIMQAIEDAMIGANMGDQIIKVQLIYLSFFENVANFDVQTYVDLFKNNPEDTALIQAINVEYGLEIDFDEFMRTYTFVMNTTIDRICLRIQERKIAPILRLGQRTHTSQAGDFKRAAMAKLTKICVIAAPITWDLLWDIYGTFLQKKLLI